jgi:hypothetical protein
MFNLCVKKIADGMHPSEVIVEFETRDGMEQMIVDVNVFKIKDQGSDIGFVNVFFPAADNLAYYLVELPRETMRGAWRVWVNKKDVQFLQGVAA